MTKIWRIAAVATIVASSPALAQTKAEVEAAYSPSFNHCMESGDAAQGITSGIMDCNGTENTLQNARLNQAYKTVMARLSAPQQAKLRTSERDWIKRRDARCREAADEAGGGSASGIIYSSCFLDETIKRTLWLKAFSPKR